MREIVLHKGKESSVKRFHPWIFSGAVRSNLADCQEGELLKVLSNTGEFLCIAYYCNSSIVGRIISFLNEPVNQEFWNKKIANAIQFRKSIGYFDNSNYNACRLINGEGDGIPGLIVDFYNGLIVFQFHNQGIGMYKEVLITAFKNSLGHEFHSCVIRNTSGESEIIFGSAEAIILENGISFKVDALNGQKTGFFLDQRNNRKLLSKYCQNKKVLNTFCYTGGFSLYAIQAGASEVISVDSSQLAIRLLDENFVLNQYESKKHRSVCADAIQYLQSNKDNYDVIVLDPPAFAKNLKARHNAVQAYKRINKMAMESIKSGGILFTFSCSQVVDSELFKKTVYSAAIEAGRNIRLIHQLGAAEDHPISLFHPEGQYLKGLVLYVE